jgi:hypothetical protein
MIVLRQNQQLTTAANNNNNNSSNSGNTEAANVKTLLKNNNLNKIKQNSSDNFSSTSSSSLNHHNQPPQMNNNNKPSKIPVYGSQSVESFKNANPYKLKQTSLQNENKKYNNNNNNKQNSLLFEIPKLEQSILNYHIVGSKESFKTHSKNSINLPKTSKFFLLQFKIDFDFGTLIKVVGNFFKQLHSYKQ